GELGRMVNPGLSPQEVEGARSLAIASGLSALQSPSTRAIEYARAVFYQQPPTDVDSYAEGLSKVTADDIKRVAMTYFKLPTASSGVLRGTVSQPAKPSVPQQ